MSQHPGAAPVHFGRRDQDLPALAPLCSARAVGRVVDPAVVLELQEPDEENKKCSQNNQKMKIDKK